MNIQCIKASKHWEGLQQKWLVIYTCYISFIIFMLLCVKFCGYICICLLISSVASYEMGFCCILFLLLSLSLPPIKLKAYALLRLFVKYWVWRSIFTFSIQCGTISWFIPCVLSMYCKFSNYSMKTLLTVLIIVEDPVMKKPTCHATYGTCN